MKRQTYANQKGMTLVEVMVALTLFSLAVTMIVGIMISMANIKYRVMMHDQQTADQKTKIESNSNRHNMDSITEYLIGGTAQTSFSIDGTLAGLFSSGDFHVFSYQADPQLATVPYDDEWKLYFFTDINKQLRGDFTSNSIAQPDVYKVIVKNTTSNDIKLTVSYDSGKLQARYYKNFSQYTELPNGTPADDLGIKVGEQVAIGVKKIASGDLMISCNGFSYTLSSAAFTGSGNPTNLKYTDTGFTL